MGQNDFCLKTEVRRFDLLLSEKKNMTKTGKRKFSRGHLGFFSLALLLLSSCGGPEPSSSASSISPYSSASSISSSSSLSSAPLDPSNIPACSESIILSSSKDSSSGVISSSSVPTSYINDRIDAIRTGHNYTLDVTSYLEGTPNDVFTDTYVNIDDLCYYNRYFSGYSGIIKHKGLGYVNYQQIGDEIYPSSFYATNANVGVSSLYDLVGENLFLDTYQEEEGGYSSLIMWILSRSLVTSISFISNTDQKKRNNAQIPHKFEKVPF